MKSKSTGKQETHRHKSISCHRLFYNNLLFMAQFFFLTGRYNKFSRELSQTPWFIDGIRKTESSVQVFNCLFSVLGYRASKKIPGV